MTPPLPRWPDLHVHWRQAVFTARALNRSGVSAFPLRSVPALSVETVDEYGTEHGIAGPARRKLISRALRTAGYRSLGAGSLGVDGWPARLEHPGPPESLAGDPAKEPVRIASTPGSIGLLTPTQAVLLLLRTNSGRMEPALQQELLHLVWEQTVDLRLVALWAGATGYRRLFALLPALHWRQFQGAELRRRGEFQSLLPS